MSSHIPDYTKINFAVDKEAAKQMIDWGVSLYHERTEIRKLNKAMYDSFNGIIDKAKINNIIKKQGETSSTPYISYRIGRNKLKQLIGEFLQIGIRATIYTINPEAKKEKYNKYMFRMGLAEFKPELEKVRSLGVDVMQGVSLPDKQQVSITDKSFKSLNEIIMQIIIDYKIANDRMIMTFLENWKHLILVSETCGKLDRNEKGADYWRPIDPNNAIFLESPGDVIVKRSPIVGEARQLYKHEILQEFNLTKDQLQKLDAMGTDNIEDSTSRSGRQLYTVYSFQFYGKKTTRVKESANTKGIPYYKFITEEDYVSKKGKIDSEVKKGKYKIVSEDDMFTIYEGHRIGTDIYTGIKEKENNIVTTEENGQSSLEFDYIFGLFGTVDGTRISLQAIVYEMEKVYNAIRRQLNIEISKLKGSFAVFDEAYFPNKTIANIGFELSEHGITTVNSSDIAMASDDREGVIDRIMKEFKLGDSQTISTLMQLALDIEQTLDRQTGMNNDRQGLGLASSTATMNQNNVNASLSMTYDMFQFMQFYINEVIGRLAEKVKINWSWLENGGEEMILSDEEFGYLKATRDLSNDSYAAFVTDGKLEYEISRKLEQYFLQDINSSRLRTVDVAKFYTTKSFAQGIKKLEDAYNELTKVQQSSEQAKLQSNEKMMTQKLQSDEALREDLQAHEKEIEVLKGKIKENLIITEGDIKKGISVDQKLRDHSREVQLKRMDSEQENAISEQ